MKEEEWVKKKLGKNKTKKILFGLLKMNSATQHHDLGISAPQR